MRIELKRAGREISPPARGYADFLDAPHTDLPNRAFRPGFSGAAGGR